ncbi:MAG: hypothetical protein Kow0080_06120 [Candidatus Promineifilaceae bacterium]
MTKTKLLWDYGTAYDMFISLAVLHEPDRYGLRGAWAAGVRSRVPNPERDMLQRWVEAMGWPLHWVYTLPAPRDGKTALQALRQMPPFERVKKLLINGYISEEWQQVWLNVAERGSYSQADVDVLLAIYNERMAGKQKKSVKKLREHFEGTLMVWADAEAFGEGLVAGLQIYYDVFFAEEESRILPALETAVARAQLLSQTLELPELLEQLTAGLRFSEEMTSMEEMVLVPSFWGAPLTLFMKINDTRRMIVFAGRPDDASLVPGDVVPDALFRALKALADPTRLRIMRYLSNKPSTPAELARRLRLRAPTVVHHLHALRLAQLVHLTFSQDEGGKRYEARREAVDAAFELLNAFLDAEEVQSETKRDTAVLRHISAD